MHPKRVEQRHPPLNRIVLSRADDRDLLPVRADGKRASRTRRQNQLRLSIQRGAVQVIIPHAAILVILPRTEVDRFLAKPLNLINLRMPVANRRNHVRLNQFLFSRTINPHHPQRTRIPLRPALKSDEPSAGR